MNKTTFWNLIGSTNIKKICIPTIQRDFALGRHGRAFNRYSFLNALKTAICGEEELSLDFVYGVDNGTMFVPLDGQQRLTTLWLLHWFIAYKAEIIKEQGIKDILKKFSYETRISSTDFCKSLCNLSPNKANESLRKWITQQTWFYHQYKQDPTIMGMLNVIAGTDEKDKRLNDIKDGLVEIFKDEECDYKFMWEKLTTSQCIQFNKLDISLDDGDELYVKMNARGKQLTDFENFKTELVQHVIDCKILNDEEALNLAAKLDVQWTDIFWENRWEDKNTKDISIDGIYFAFIRRFVRLECINKQGENSELLKKFNRTFTSFKPYKEILDKQSIHDFIKIMDNLWRHKLETTSSWGEDFDFIPKYRKTDIPKLEKTQTLLFYGYCRYLLCAEYDEETFTEWSRVLWNICENRVEPGLRSTMSEIDILAPHSHNILSYLSQEEVIRCEYNKEQLLEEQCKARHITIYPMIREIEGNTVFRGVIRFLYTGEDGSEDWASFETKVQNVKELIPKDIRERHTIKQFIPYIAKQSLAVILYHWISNKDKDLRKILLDKDVIPYLHNFLLKNEKKKSISVLHQDIMDICEEAFDGRGYLQTKWTCECKYIWTNYSRASGNYRWMSYIVGNRCYMTVSKFLEESDNFEIYKKQQKRRIGNHIQGLYLNFKYRDHYFTLYGNNTICLMTDMWEEKDSVNGKELYIPVKNNITEELLIEEIEKVLHIYRNNVVS